MFREAGDGPAVVYNERLRRAPKSAEIVALEIVRDIVSRELQPGDTLFSEAGLIDRHGYSKPIIKEALRLLEIQGLVSIRPGPGGGIAVGFARAENLAQTLVLYLHLAEATYKELIDAWVDTKALMASHAARNPDRVLVKKLLEPFLSNSSACYGDMRLTQAGLNFHQNVDILADNRVMNITYKAISLVAAIHILPVIETELSDEHIDDHADVARAILEGEADLAGLLMRRHILHISAAFQRVWPEKVGQRLTWALSGSPAG